MRVDYFSLVIGDTAMTRYLSSFRSFTFTLAAAMCAAALAQTRVPVADVQATSSFFAGFQTIVATDQGLVEDPPGSGRYRFLTSALDWTANYGTPNDEAPLIHFEFDQPRTIDRFWVWNNNGWTFRGFREVAVQYSDDGVRWKTFPRRYVFDEARGGDFYFGQGFTLPFPVRTKFIRFNCHGTWRQGGNPDVAGLGRVWFFEGGTPGDPGPETGPFPRVSGYVNVKDAPYNAVGDGVTDDQPAIQRAILDWQGSGRIVYIPEGTYLLGSPLRYRTNSTNDRNSFFGFSNLFGAGSSRTTLRLRDGVLTDVNNPQPVLFNGYLSFFNGSFEETTADWFNNNIRGFTIDTGSNNPGAKGIEFFSNNTGSLRDVVIRSGDGAGRVGLELGHVDKNGPLLVQGLRVEGFDIGVRTATTVNSLVFDDITLNDQRQVAFLNEGQCVSIRKLVTNGTVEALRSNFGHVAIVDSRLTGSGAAGSLPAMLNGEYFYARNVEVEGFGLGLRNEFGNAPNAPESIVGDYVSNRPVLSLFGGPARSLNLDVPVSPVFPTDPAGNWANVRDFRLTTERDEALAFQRAVDSGAETVYFPSGVTVDLFSDVELRGSVRRVVGFFSVYRTFNNAKVTLGAGVHPAVLFEQFRGLNVGNAGSRTLAVSDSESSVVSTGTGPVFVENVVGDRFVLTPGQRLTARQLNTETEGTKITNDGGTLWILGLKTERGGTLVESLNGARSEIVGGLCYTTTAGRLGPMFTVVDSDLSVSIGEVCYTFDPYTVLVRERQGRTTRQLDRGQAPFRFSFMQGSDLPLFRAARTLKRTTTVRD